MTYEDLQVVLGAFEREGVDYVLIGGGAVNVHGLIRMKRGTVRPIDQADAQMLMERFNLEAED